MRRLWDQDSPRLPMKREYSVSGNAFDPSPKVQGSSPCVPSKMKKLEALRSAETLGISNEHDVLS